MLKNALSRGNSIFGAKLTGGSRQQVVVVVGVAQLPRPFVNQSMVGVLPRPLSTQAAPDLRSAELYRTDVSTVR
jgi:hypothetical protein